MKQELILETYEKALEDEGERHRLSLKEAKETCLKALKEARQGKKQTKGQEEKR